MASISFARGVPSPDILPVAELAECAAAVIEAEGQTILNYGPAFGYLPLREWVGAQHGVAADRVLLTPGSLMGFNFVARHLLGEGGPAVVEAPTYDRTLGVLRGVGSAIQSVPLSEAGLDLDRVETLLGADPPPKLLYVIPTFQNPSGRTLSTGQRHALVELAAARGVIVFEDDPYRLVRYSGEPEPTLHELAGGEGVIFASSFSKTAAPGLRVGYLVLPEPLVAPANGCRGLQLHRACAAASGGTVRADPSREVRANARADRGRPARAPRCDARWAGGRDAGRHGVERAGRRLLPLGRSARGR